MTTSIPKPRRVKDKKALAAARKEFCEYCLTWGPVHVHHIRSRGAGGNDEPANLIDLCPFCHDKVHRGLIPRERLREIVRGRNA